MSDSKGCKMLRGVDEEVWWALRVLALAHRRSVAEEFNEAITHWLQNQPEFLEAGGGATERHAPPTGRLGASHT